MKYVALTLTILFTQIAAAQFTSGTNPINSLDLGTDAAPMLEDMNGDGFLDYIVSVDKAIHLFINDQAGDFVQMTGAANFMPQPNIMDLTARPVDIDNDFDYDLAIGDGQGDIQYWENTGSATNPVYTERTHGDNPFYYLDLSDLWKDISVDFADLDNDGDLDMIAGGKQGDFLYFRNDGTADAPNYTDMNAAARMSNPFGAFVIPYESTPEFIDFDLDGDIDLLSGNNTGGVHYYENVGTVSSPVYTERTGAANPFASISMSDDVHIFVADGDCDGAWDVFAGAGNGQVIFLSGTSPAGANSCITTGGLVLPIDLVSFDVEQNLNAVNFSWVVENQVNTAYFVLQVSKDGNSFSDLHTVLADGNLSERKAFKHIWKNGALDGVAYFRLKMIDLDGAFKYSEIVALSTTSISVVAAPSIYPTLVSGTTVNLTTEFSGNVALYNLNGQMIFQQDLKEGRQLEIGTLANGQYLLLFTDLAGNSSTERFVRH